MNLIRQYASYLTEPLHSRSRTVRYMFPVVLGLSAAMAATALTSQSSSLVRLEPTQSLIAAGDPFSIDVYAYAHVPVNAVELEVVIPTDVATVSGIDTGESVITIWTEEPSTRRGRVQLRGGTFQRGFQGEHLIATINLVAREETGSARFVTENIKFLAGDGEGSVVVVDHGQGTETLDLYVHDAREDPAQIRTQISDRLRSDINNDGRITLQDISVFMSAWHAGDRLFDFDRDGRMSFRDFSIILADYFLR